MNAGGSDLLAYDPGRMTLPHEMVAWFEKAGFRDVINETNLLLTKSEEHLRRASRLHSVEDYWVCLFINSTMLDTNTTPGKAHPQNHDGSLTPDHCVTLTSEINFTSDGRASMDVFSWGKGHYKVPKGGVPLAVRDLLRNYYGFVAVRR